MFDQPLFPAEPPVGVSTDFGLCILDLAGTVLACDERAESIEGHRAADLIGRSFAYNLSNEDKAAGVPQSCMSLAESTGRFHGRLWQVRENGSGFWAAVSIVSMRAQSGKVIGYAKMISELANSVSAGQPPKIGVSDLERLIQGVTDYAVYMLDPRGIITSWNSGAQRIKGYAAQEIIGKHFGVFFTREDSEADKPRQALEIADRDGRYEIEAWRVRKDGCRYWANVVIDRIGDENGKLVGFAKITRDISERRQAQLRIEAAQVEKMEALTQLTAGVSHDFNNLLNAVSAAAEVGLQQIFDSEKTRRILETIRSSAKKGSTLTRQLLAFSRQQPLALTVIDLSTQLSSTASLLQVSLGANVNLIWEMADSLWKIEADLGQLELALLNLGINARDAMEHGGVVRINATNRVLYGSPNGLYGPHVAISVSDTGSGIRPDVVSRIFEPFFTTKSFGKGTGLGLSQVFGYVRQLNGSVIVESEIGKGSTFTLFIPASTGAIGARVGLTKAKILASSSKAKILIVDDNEIIAELAGDYLRECGFITVSAYSGAGALAEIFDRENLPDLMFCDVVMPGGISGLDLARKVRSQFPELPILLATGYSDQSGDTHGFPVISKPYDLGSLASEIELALGGSGMAMRVNNVSPTTVDRTRILDQDLALNEDPLRELVNFLGPERVGKLIGDLAEDLRKRLDIPVPRAAKDLADYAHALKSQAAQLGCSALATLCNDIEQEARGGRMPRRSDELPAAIRSTLAAIEAYRSGWLSSLSGRPASELCCSLASGVQPRSAIARTVESQCANGNVLNF